MPNQKPTQNDSWCITVLLCKKCESLPAARAAKPFSAQMILFPSEIHDTPNALVVLHGTAQVLPFVSRVSLPRLIPGCEECGNTQKGAFFNSPSLLAKQSGRNITVPLHSKSSKLFGHDTWNSWILSKSRYSCKCTEHCATVIAARAESAEGLLAVSLTSNSVEASSWPTIFL